MNMSANTSFKSAETAFNTAIADGRLSASKTASNYAGNFMYMGTYGGKDQFKNLYSREYLA